MAASQKVLCVIVIACVLFNAGVLGQQTQAAAEEQASELMAEGRTFSHHFMKRLSFAVVPGAFVVGVITTLLAALTVVSMKGLGVGVILLVLAIGQMLSRTLSAAQAVTAYHAAPAAAPVPIVYSHAHTQQPVWLEKEW